MGTTELTGFQLYKDVVIKRENFEIVGEDFAIALMQTKDGRGLEINVLVSLSDDIGEFLKQAFQLYIDKKWGFGYRVIIR